MYSHLWNNRKRERDEEDKLVPSSFDDHRDKRLASLPDRTSTRHNRLPLHTDYPLQPLPPTITPAESDSEWTSTATEPKSFSSPWASSTCRTLTPTSPSLDAMDVSQSSQSSDLAMLPEECEMDDTIHLSPGSLHETSITGRIPTPIHSTFGTSIRTDRASRHLDPDFADDEAGLVDRFRRGRRLPSPISEGEASPTTIIDGMGGMQVDVPQDIESATPTKKGHTRSKHSLRSWTVPGADPNATGVKRTFTMGYRSDCEKCRNKVVGHFSHIITS